MGKSNKAFTLTELLIALGIIGAIAAMSIPSLMSSINNRILTNQLKSMVGSLQQLASDQLITQKTKDLSGTDFNDPEALISDGYFAVSKVCSSTAAAQDCWKTSGTSAIKYRNITSKTATDVNGPNYKSAILKNGAVIGYKKPGLVLTTAGATDVILGEFCFDVNGNDYPNIVGRDYFCVNVTKKGKIVDTLSTSVSTNSKITSCTGNTDKSKSPSYCYGAIVESGWQMPY